MEVVLANDSNGGHHRKTPTPLPLYESHDIHCYSPTLPALKIGEKMKNHIGVVDVNAIAAAKLIYNNMLVFFNAAGTAIRASLFKVPIKYDDPLIQKPKTTTRANPYGFSIHM